MEEIEKNNQEEKYSPKGSIVFFMMLIGFISILWFVFYLILIYRN